MGSFFRKNGGKLISLFFMLYLIFFMKLGAWTFAQHWYRIATTPESKELVDEVFRKGTRFGHDMERRVRGAVSRPYN
jgi:hypothetical protein